MTSDALKAGAAAGDTVLEALQAALVSLDRHPFDYYDWTKCACGHIYRGVVGFDTTRRELVSCSRNARYQAVLEVVALANGLTIDRESLAIDPGWYLAEVVSDGTASLAGSNTDPASLKDATVLMIERAIEWEQARNAGLLPLLELLELAAKPATT